MEALAILAALIGALWLMIFITRGSLFVGIVVYLVVNSCLGVYFWMFEVGPMPMSLDRIALIAVILTCLLQRHLGDTAPPPMRGAEWSMLALLCLLTISNFTHDFANAGPGTVTPIWRLMSGYWVPALLFWMTRQTRVSQQQFGFMMAVLTLMGLYLSVTAICEIHHQWAFVFPKTIGDQTLGFHFGRARGPMLHSVSFGYYLAICMLAGCLWLPTFGRKGILALALLLPLNFIGLYYSYTRSVWIGAALGLLIILTLVLKGRMRMAVLGLTVTAGLALVVMKGDKILGFQREYSAADTRLSAELRSNFAYVSWQMFWDRPILGCGFGQFYFEKIPYLADRTTELRLETIRDLIHHNTPLGVLTETGLVGLFLTGALLWFWVRDAWHLWSTPLVPNWIRQQGLLMLAAMGVYLSQAAFHEVSYMNLMQMLIFFLAGVTTQMHAVVAPLKKEISSLSSLERLSLQGAQLAGR